MASDDVPDYRDLPLAVQDAGGWYVTDGMDLLCVRELPSDVEDRRKLPYVLWELPTGRRKSSGIVYVPEGETVRSVLTGMIDPGDRLSFRICDTGCRYGRRIDEAYLSGGLLLKRMSAELAGVYCW